MSAGEERELECPWRLRHIRLLVPLPRLRDISERIPRHRPPEKDGTRQPPRNWLMKVKVKVKVNKNRRRLAIVVSKMHFIILLFLSLLSFSKTIGRAQSKTRRLPFPAVGKTEDGYVETNQGKDGKVCTTSSNQPVVTRPA